jgi:hypothetical protein
VIIHDIPTQKATDLSKQIQKNPGKTNTMIQVDFFFFQNQNNFAGGKTTEFHDIYSSGHAKETKSKHRLTKHSYQERKWI